MGQVPDSAMENHKKTVWVGSVLWRLGGRKRAAWTTRLKEGFLEKVALKGRQR